jgi:hypothetical protein
MYQHLPLQDPPKCIQSWVVGLKINHLATLVRIPVTSKRFLKHEEPLPFKHNQKDNIKKFSPLPMPFFGLKLFISFHHVLTVGFYLL